MTVEVTSQDAPNDPPKAVGDAIRLRVGSTGTVDVKANDTDPDGDDLVISLPPTLPPGVHATIVSQRLSITLEPGAQERSVVNYDLSDGAGHTVTGKVLVVRIGDTAVNRPPVANPDAVRVVIGSSVSIPVTTNDIDPDNDTIRLLSVEQPAEGVGTTTVEGNSVRFTPNMPNITEPTPVSFSYRITDGKNNEVNGTVTVTVLLEALPRRSVRPRRLRRHGDRQAGQHRRAGQRQRPVRRNSQPQWRRRSARTVALQRSPTTSESRSPRRSALSARSDASTTSATRVAWVPQASIIVTVTSPPPGNHDPVINAAALQKDVPVGTSSTFNAGDLATDDDGDNLVFVSVGKPDHGSTTFSQKSATFTYTAPSTSSADHTPVGDSFDVTISDGHDGNARGTISIRITDNSPVATPPNTHDPTVTATVGQQTRFDVIAELQQSNPSTSLTLVNASPDSSTPEAAVDFSGNSVLITPKASGALTITYTVKNSDGLTANGKLRVTIVDPPPVNPPPQAVADELTVPSGGVNSVNLLANDLGINDPGDKAFATLRSRPPTSFGTLDLRNGILTLTAGPGPNGGQAVISYDLDDGSGQTSTATVTLIIQDCSESAPQASAAQLFTPYMTPVAIDLNQYVVSGTIVPGSVSGAGLTAPTGTYTPPQGMNGSEVVTYTVTNGCNEIDHGVLTIDVNRAPVGGDVTRNMSPGQYLDAERQRSRLRRRTIVDLQVWPATRRGSRAMPARSSPRRPATWPVVRIPSRPRSKIPAA